MSLPLLVAVVAVGITVVVLAVHLTGGSAPARIDAPDAAVARFAVDFPEETIGRVLVAEDGETAFLELASGALGIVHGVGDMFLTRRVLPAGVDSVELRGQGEIVLRLDDTTWSGGTFVLGDREAAEAVLRRLAPPQQAREEVT